MSWRVITRYNPNRSGMAEIAKGKPLAHAVHKIAASALPIAEHLAPDGFGGYAGKFEIIDEIIEDIPNRVGSDPPMARVCATLINQGELAILVEVGSSRSREYRVLGTTLRWIDAQAHL